MRTFDSPALPLQQAFPLYDLQHAQLAALRARNPFFERVHVDHSYSRTLFCGRGLLFVAYHSWPLGAWKVHMSTFTHLEQGDWFTLIPHPPQYSHSSTAKEASEELAVHIHAGPWHEALSIFATVRLEAEAKVPGNLANLPNDDRYPSGLGSLT